MRRCLTVVGCGMLVALPPAAAAQSDGALTNDEVVLATLDPSGLPSEALLISRISAGPGPVREIADPSSTTNLSYRDRRGSPRTDGDAVVVPIGGDSATTVLTEALFDKPLPVALHARYEAGGRAVDPAELLGATGEVAITYTATNTTAQQQTITATDAAGVARSRELPVFAPFAGTLVVRVPADMTVLEAPGAAASTDAEGSTVLRFDLLLAPPAGDFTSDVAVRLDAPAGAATPEVVMTVAPVTAAKNPALGFAEELLTSSADGSVKLADGLGAMQEATSQLAAGAVALAAGAADLAAGQQRLADGLASGASAAQAAASGSADLATGLGTLSAGLQALSGPQGLPAAADAAAKLQAGAGLLAELVGSSSDGPWSPQIVPPSQEWPPNLPPWPPTAGSLPDWANAIATLPPALRNLSFVPDGMPRDGVCRLDANGDGQLDDPITDIDCVPTLVQSLRLLSAAASALAGVAAEIPPLLAAAGTDLGAATTAATDASAQAGAAAAAANALSAQVCGVPALLSAQQCAELAGIAGSAAAAAASTGAAATSVGSAGAALTDAGARATALAAGLPALTLLLKGTTAVAERVGDGLRSGNPAQPGLTEGVAGLADALRTAAAASGQLSSGSQSAQSGATVLASGAATLAAGIGEASAGASALAQGAEGIGDGSQALAEGVNRLDEEGISPALASVIDASADASFASAYLAAVDARAADAMPYGAPEGAVGNAAYVLTMPATAAPGSGQTWAAAGLGLLVATGFAVALVRRRRG